MKKSILLLLVIQALMFKSWAVGDNKSPQSANSSYYNELYEGETLREAYQSLSDYLLSPDFQADQEMFLVSSRKAFQKDNALDPIPRILSPKESDEIQRGVDQRARALRAFLKDHYSGKKFYVKARIIPEDVVKRIISRAGEASYEGLIHPQTISFMYGPDIIRDAQGQWRVIEDNPGFIGGLGDLKLAYDLMVEKHPSLKKAFEFADPMTFYRSVARAYREKGLQYGGKTILYMTPPYADNEDKRIEKIFAAEGIEVITPTSDQKLRITADGVYLNSRVRGETIQEKVGYVFMNGEHSWLDNTHPASRIRNVLEASNEYLKDKKAKPNYKKQIAKWLSNLDPETHLPNIAELERLLKRVDYLDQTKSHAAGLLKMILSNKVGSNYSPGVDFIGDKEFYVYVEEMIRHYLHEEPILKNIPTQKFVDEKTGQFKSDLARTVSLNKEQFVLKKVDGRGGDAVWVGSKTPQADFDRVLNEISKNPSVYIVQQFMHLSVHGQNIVDLRAISAVLPDRVIVAETPWGRGLPMNGNGKVNLSDQGREVTVLVTKAKRALGPVRCEAVYRLAN